MDTHSFEVLEFDKIKNLLLEEVKTVLGRELVLNLKPSKDIRWILERQIETTEAKELLMKDDISLRGVLDIRPLIKRAEKDGVLSGEELWQILETLRIGRAVKRKILQAEGEYPALRKIALRIQSLRDLERSVERALNHKGEVLDSASEELAQIRRKLKSLRTQINTLLASILSSDTYSEIIQEKVIVIRNQRYCIPIKSSLKYKFHGLVHDQSKSTQTVFMEPIEAIEINNELIQRKREEAEEISNILKKLTKKVKRKSNELKIAIESLGVLDFIMAKGMLSIHLRCSEPKLTQDGEIEIINGRHPLLKGRVVPISMNLGRGFNTLIITGPNTGGKTVSLKTIGLHALMAQAGLHIPAEEGTKMNVFDGIYADIGDEQSIEQNLSTFSSHLREVIKILRRAGRNTLVLLDEIASGTDPSEGASLARAILEYLHKRGAKTVATTHSNELKTFAYLMEGVENACMEFDPQTLLPTYKLSIGHPGSSNALVIGERLGLPKIIIDRANELKSPNKSVVSDLIQKVEETYTKTREEREEARRLKEKFENLKAEYEQSLKKLKFKKSKILEEAYIEALKIVRDTEEKAREILRLAAKREDEALIKKSLGSIHQNISKKLGEFKREEETLSPASVEIGKKVFIKSLNIEGLISNFSEDGKIEVQTDTAKVNVPLSHLREIKEEKSVEKDKSWSGDLKVEKELNLLGLTVEESLERVDRYLTNAYASKVTEVKIIHGKGSGALRGGVQKFLMEHPLVEAFRMGNSHEGGMGITIVYLKDR